MNQSLTELSILLAEYLWELSPGLQDTAFESSLKKKNKLITYLCNISPLKDFIIFALFSIIVDHFSTLIMLKHLQTTLHFLYSNFNSPMISEFKVGQLGDSQGMLRSLRKPCQSFLTHWVHVLVKGFNDAMIFLCCGRNCITGTHGSLQV